MSRRRPTPDRSSRCAAWLPTPCSTHCGWTGALVSRPEHRRPCTGCAMHRQTHPQADYDDKGIRDALLPFLPEELHVPGQLLGQDVVLCEAAHRGAWIACSGAAAAGRGGRGLRLPRQVKGRPLPSLVGIKHSSSERGTRRSAPQGRQGGLAVHAAHPWPSNRVQGCSTRASNDLVSARTRHRQAFGGGALQWVAAPSKLCPPGLGSDLRASAQRFMSAVPADCHPARAWRVNQIRPRAGRSAPSWP